MSRTLACKMLRKRCFLFVCFFWGGGGCITLACLCFGTFYSVYHNKDLEPEKLLNMNIVGNAIKCYEGLPSDK